MKKNNIKILLLVLIILTIPVIVKFSYALNNDVRSEEYTIKENKIYAVPTTYNYRVEELLSKIESEKELKILNSNNEELKKGDNVYTGCKLSVENNIYDIIVLGDVTGDGLIQIGDVAAIYNHYKGNKQLNDSLVESGKLTGNTVVNIGDVAKLYNYYRGKKAFSYYNQNMIDVDSIVVNANSYYSSSDSNTLGTNIIDKLNTNYNNGDQVVVTKDGKVELAIKKEDKCYRKSALSNEIKLVEKEYCENNIDEFVSNNGHLHVCGTNLCNEEEDIILLHGVASGINVPKYLSEETLYTVKNWGANIIRLMVNAKVSWNLYYVGHEDEYINTLKLYIDRAINNDMYVIINWDPQRNGGDFLTDNAIDFFTRLTSLYPNDPHIIYEIVNEPLDNNTWKDVKNHANRVIPVIREISPDALILVGTPYYDDKIDEVIDDQLSYNNIMYTFHRYMSQLDDSTIDKLENTRKSGLPVFVSEWGTMGLGENRPLYMEANATAFSKYLKEHGYNYIMFALSESNGQTYNNPSIVKQGEWSNDLPDSSLTDGGLAMKNILLNNSNYFKTNLLRSNKGDDPSIGHTYRSKEWKDKIISIDFKSNLEIPENAVVQWDLSMSRDNSIIGYLTPSDVLDRYKMTIAADGKIYAPSESGYLFANLSNLETINFNNFDTKETFYISAMFENDIKLKELDFSQLDGSRIMRMNNTFKNCKNLESINFSNWNPIIESIGYTFENCEKLTSLDLSSFNVNKATKFNGMFYGNKSLKELNISTWNPSSVIATERMFYNCTSLETVDMRSFSIQSTTSVTDALKNVKSQAKFIVKDQSVIDIFQTTANNNLNFVISE